MEYHHHTEQGQCVLTLKGKFSFTDYPGFRNDAMTLLSGEPMQLLVIDCENLDFIDSAGLGMLILMREEAEARNPGRPASYLDFFGFRFDE